MPSNALPRAVQSLMPTQKPTNVRWLIVAMLVVLVFLAHFNRAAISVAGAERFIGEDRISAVQMGRVYFVFLLVYSVFMLPGGWLIDHLGTRWAMAAMGLGLGFCAAMTGVLGWFGLAISALYVPLLLIRGLGGLTCVPLHPGAARSVSLWIPMSRRSTANGLVTGGALVGIALSYPLFGWMMDRLDWPAAFVVAGATLMLCALIWFLLSADHPTSHRMTNSAERDLVAREQSIAPRSTATIHDVRKLFLNRSLVLLTLSYGALSYVQYLFFNWIEYYLEQRMGLPKEESREASFIILMSMAIGMACGGWVSDRLCRWLGYATGCRIVAFGGMGLCAAFSVLGVCVNDPQAVVWCFSLSLGSLGLCEGIFWTTAPDLEKRNGGLACALLNTGGNGVGMFAPLLTPLIAEEFGWSSAVVVACIVCAIGGLLWLGIRSKSENAKVLGS
jgi:MFS transporter, ACS family, D-galactonate transporter